MSYTVGIDTSKDWLDIAVLESGECWRVVNDESGWAELSSKVKRRKRVVFGIEASGGYERGVIRWLLKAGRDVRRVNPLRLRRFAQAAGVQAKNDKIDAIMIARFVTTLPTRAVQLNPLIERLAELVGTRAQLDRDLTRQQNQSAHMRDALVVRLRRRQIAQLKIQIALLDKAIAKLVSDNDELDRKSDLMQSACGVGPVLSHTLLALMPELGELTSRQAAALLGAAPYDHDSGKLKGQRAIWGGRKYVRGVAYMAALSASQHNPTLKTFYRRLIDAGKPHKLAIVAVMRKLIVALNAMIKTGTTWQTMTP